MVRASVHLVLICVLTALAAWRMCVLGLSGNWAESDPTIALSWNPRDPDALIAQADHSGAKHTGLDAAAVMARAALLARPLDGRSYRVLADIAEKKTDQARAYALFSQAVRFAPRDLRTRVWLMQHALESGRLSDALVEMDTVMRIAPQLQPAIFPVLAAISRMPQEHAHVADLLSLPPPWRQQFWLQFCQVAGNSKDATALYELLKKRTHPLQKSEIEAWMESLIKDERWNEAYAIWVDTLPESEIHLVGNVFDGGFEADPKNAGFAWRVDPISGATVDFLRAESVTGSRALVVEFNGQRVPFRQVRQLLTLPPGEYALKGRLRLDRLHNERGIQWVLDCAGEGKPRQIGETERFMGSWDWREFDTRFSVPADGCEAQWLRLELAARIPAEQFASGMVWFDNLDISRAYSKVAE